MVYEILETILFYGGNMRKYNNKYNNNWTNEQIQYLMDNYKGKTQKELASYLKKSHTTVSKKMIELGIKTTYKERHNWNEKEIQFIKDNYMSMTYKEMALRLNRPQVSVEQKARKIGINKSEEMNITNYTKEDVDYLKSNISKLSYSEMAKTLNRTPERIRSKCFQLGIIPKENRTKLKKEQVFFIIENCNKYTDTELANMFQVSDQAISEVRKQYGIKKVGNEIKGPTYIEQVVMKILEELNIRYIYNKELGLYRPDFLIKDKKIIVEAQGDYFHCNPYVYKDGPKDEIQIKHVIRDYYKKCYYLSRGYELIEIWELEINQDVEKVKEKIKSAVLA